VVVFKLDPSWSEIVLVKLDPPQPDVVVVRVKVPPLEVVDECVVMLEGRELELKVEGWTWKSPEAHLAT